MRVLVTGGTGVVGTGVVTALIQRGHTVRLLSRNAERDVSRWDGGATAWPGDVAIESSVKGAAEGCDAVLHLVAIVDESPPDATFQRVNVDGTEHVMREAERQGVQRFVYVSSLGADTGESPYHRSKRAGEEIVRRFSGDWLIVRPGAVYGPGDDHISVLLQMLRTSPVIPTLGDGRQSIQPLWHEDAAEALAIAVERVELRGEVLEVAGPEVISQHDLVERLAKIVGRNPVKVPLPEVVASWGLKALGALDLEGPFTESQLTMLSEGNAIRPGSRNALSQVLGVSPTPLERGLELLADAQIEQLPSEGVGSLRQKRFWADIVGSSLDGDELFSAVCERFGALMPSIVEVGAEPATPARITDGETLTLGLPLRGHVQVRVVELTARRCTMVTLHGHPLAGLVRLLVEERGDRLRFEVQTYSRPAGALDFLVMRTVGDLLQDASWVALVENVVRESDGRAEVEQSVSTPTDDQAEEIVEWARAAVGQLS